MKLTIERAALLKALTHVQSVVERRNTIPVLSNVLMQASGGTLRLTATDLDVEIVEHVSADVIDEGGTTAPAHTLHDIVRKLPDGAQVQIDAGGDDPRLQIAAGRARFQLATLPREDFPDMAAGEMPHRFAVNPAVLGRMIDRTRFAISTEETRYYLNGIYLHVAGEGKKKVLRGVATDGHRLARYDAPCPDGADGMPGVIVPRKTVAELRKLIEDPDDDAVIEVALSDTKIRFEFGSVVLTSKLIDGTFPDYQRVIPTDNDKVLEVVGKAFAEAVDRVATISSEKSRAVKLILDDDKLTLSVTNPDSGTATEELAVDYKADRLEIGFNARYLIDITGQLEGDNARFFLADANAPTVVRDAQDESALFVLMPMRV